MKVSIVIVCMNNLRTIYPCLTSIRKFTRIDYEVLLVAYKFSEENILKLRNDFPWVIILENNEICGFAENNNIALNIARGDYCFILNDDTYFDTPVVDDLYYSMIKNSGVDIMSPNLYYPDGREQFLGKPTMSATKFVLTTLKLWGESNMRRKYIERTGIYDIDNISGAAFMIKTDVFRKLGWFDERYFFSPEDIALSTKARVNGYKICQNSEVKIYHIASGTSSPISAATLPASFKGHLLFYSNDKRWKLLLLCAIEFPIVITKYLCYRVLYVLGKDETYKIRAESERNTFMSMGNRLTPKELFIKYYTKIINKQ